MLGQYPTGVCVVAATEVDGTKVGMVVGSFSSASLDPPLVAFFVDKSSTGWPRVAQVGAFSVNVLGADQQQTCQRLSSKDPDKFDSVATRPTKNGSPLIEDSVAWMDCTVYATQEAGDHWLILGLVHEMRLERPRLPLLFFRGGYGHFAPLSLAAPDPRGVLTTQLRQADLIRREAEQLSIRLAARCGMSALVGHEVVVIGSADAMDQPGTPATFAGQRVPFVAPVEPLFAAWATSDVQKAWIASRPASAPEEPYWDALEAVRRRGVSLGLDSQAQREWIGQLESSGSHQANVSSVDFYAMTHGLLPDPAQLTDESRLKIRHISAPVFDAQGEVALVLGVFGFPKPQVSIDEYLTAGLIPSWRLISVWKSSIARRRALGPPDQGQSVGSAARIFATSAESWLRGHRSRHRGRLDPSATAASVEARLPDD